uniref:Scaffolding anchor of CK1 domain-containing protein n=1 Tax=Astatotilapia calliptera TaxID=8154 RepID=A0A3P8NL48_ASTCA
MESPEFSLLSSLRGEFKSEDFIQPHYKESYRLAIDRLVNGGRDSYQEFLKGERLGSFLSEDEILFITGNAEQLPPQTQTEEIKDPSDTKSSSGTYWPMHSDVETPNLDLGWPEVLHEMLQTNIDLLFHPPRLNSPTIKEVIRKHIQDARQNMRVRTVKGQDYRCRLGAKFHGAMEQKFLLADCHTAIYGSYSFTWSFEKINLSMVQIITGHLVKSYDEEFRTLYARSIVPPELCPPEGLLQRNGSLGQQILPNCHSAPNLQRRDMLRQSLDTVYRKTRERNLGQRDYEERLFEEEDYKLRPLMENGIGVQEFQSVEEMNFFKRHSYAGERQDGHESIPQNIKPRGSNWNISRDGANNYAMNNYLQVPQIHRSHNLQSYNGNDKRVLSKQQNMPTLENMSKSYMRTLRIESYLNNPDVPFGDSCDYLDQFEQLDKASPFMQGGMRSSLALRPTVQEQMEANRYLHTSSSLSPTKNSHLHYSSMQWTPTGAGYDTGRNPYHSYANLSRAKDRQIITNPNIFSDNWVKRHSVADPRSSTHESSNHMYNAFVRMQEGQSEAAMTALNGGHGSNLNEDQRSVSHYDVKSMTSTKSPSGPIWQEPPARALSAAALDVKSKDLTDKSNRTGAKKITSLLNIQEKKENSIRNSKTPSLTSADSSDTLTAEDEEKTSVIEQKHLPSRSISLSYSSERQRNNVEGIKSLKSRFQAEKEQQPPQSALSKTTTQKKPSIFDKNTRPGFHSSSWSKDRGGENRLSSRFEPFGSSEKKTSLRTPHSFRIKPSQEKSKSLPKGEAAIELNSTQAARGHHENKLEKFFQRVGNFIHKNK